jgi:hypothetical protein
MIVQVILDGYTVRASDATQVKPYMTDGWDGYGDGFGNGFGRGDGKAEDQTIYIVKEKTK